MIAMSTIQQLKNFIRHGEYECHASNQDGPTVLVSRVATLPLRTRWMAWSNLFTNCSVKQVSKPALPTTPRRSLHRCRRMQAFRHRPLE